MKRQTYRRGGSREPTIVGEPRNAKREMRNAKSLVGAGHALSRKWCTKRLTRPPFASQPDPLWEWQSNALTARRSGNGATGKRLDRNMQPAQTAG